MRKPQVTRTITTSTISVLAMDIVKSEVVKTEYILSGVKLNNDTTLKEVQKLYNTDTVKVVAIQNIITNTALYGMSEEDFVKYARILPDRK